MKNEKVVKYVKKAINILSDERYKKDVFSHTCGYRYCIVGWMASFGCKASHAVVVGKGRQNGILKNMLDIEDYEFFWLFNADADELTREQTIEYLQLVVDNDGDVKAAMDIWGEHEDHVIKDA